MLSATLAARPVPSYRWCGQARIRIRYTHDRGGRPCYAGAVTFPDGKRWPFRDLCPAPSVVPGKEGLDPESNRALDRAAGEAVHFCGYMGNDVHREDLDNAMQWHGDSVPGGNENRYRIARTDGGRCVYITKG